MNKQKALTINIPEPCNENWDAMQVSGCGRFCAHCEKVVIDFTQMTDAEIVKIFRIRKGNPPCGRFSEEQLNHPLMITEDKSSFSIARIRTKVAAAFLLVPGFLQHSYAQAKQITQTEQAPSPEGKTPFILKGKIMDALSGDPLAAMEISIDKLDFVKYSDKDGNFSFVLPDSLMDKLITIEANYQSASVITDSSIIAPQTILVTGDLARTTLYLLRTYPNKANNTNQVVETGYKHYLGEAYTTVPVEHFKQLESKPKIQSNKPFRRLVRGLFRRKD